MPEGAWGLDIFIGGARLAGKGIGSRAVRLLSDHLFAERGATAVALVTEAGNARAQAAYVRGGNARVGALSWTPTHALVSGSSRLLMIRDRPGGTAGGR